ncbi:MAG: hypothetical protein MRERC_7c071 [Mycoplasmataceae bacterium RC_NB112A]|nr:MAG: hypothetical protein MRERC_8c070 [Mycoplasmataceae bacterium RC_NB112A]KLL01906.1 MAG: hypothetical protein MRERC_7c071 [Mycoplasmataceae bacterium RC_NB112A]
MANEELTKSIKKKNDICPNSSVQFHFATINTEKKREILLSKYRNENHYRKIKKQSSDKSPKMIPPKYFVGKSPGAFQRYFQKKFFCQSFIQKLFRTSLLLFLPNGYIK